MAWQGNTVHRLPVQILHPPPDRCTGFCCLPLYQAELCSVHLQIYSILFLPAVSVTPSASLSNPAVAVFIPQPASSRLYCICICSVSSSIPSLRSSFNACIGRNTFPSIRISRLSNVTLYYRFCASAFRFLPDLTVASVPPALPVRYILQ